jgi:5,10-methylenetetrahydromethanopterin reductase
MTIATSAPASPGHTGIVIRDPLPWQQFVQVIRTAEETGYWALFVPEIAGREAFGTLAGLATVTERIRLGTGVVTMRSRDPATTAMGAATIQDLSAGRHVLGLGTGASPKEQGAGPGPLRLMGRYVQLVREILAGGLVEAEGPFPMDAFQLSLPMEMGPPPIWLGALGNRMLALAAGLADGVIMNWCTPNRVREARGIIDEAAAAAGRDPSEVTISVYVRACLGVEERVALVGLREMTGQYASIPHYRSQMEAMGLGVEARSAASAFAEGRPEDVPDALVRALTVVGGRGEALARFAAYQEAGADLVLCYPVPAREPFSSILGTVLAAAPTTSVER